ncbi:hypothetical protein ECG_01906 [Echinococcus granulosus]|uniref:Vesicle transport protein SEC20 n=1 Tax=Echinococcus granulosus TaxID=6210 RepID=A0A068W7C3_ECHGR|nr:hypothetical protein ECG_01906 [Echinococcus granulosus]CDS15133.1 Vesicle transport protein SEC20 [Echinococcus granulosus]
MSTRLVYQQCVDECTSIQDIVTSILSIKDEPTNLIEKRKRFDALQSDGRKHLSALKSFIGKLDQILDLTATPANRKKLDAIENQYASFLELFRKAIYTTSKSLEISERSALLSNPYRSSNFGGDSDFHNQLEASLQLTTDMRLHARRLAEEVARGNANAELVDNSSNQVEENLRELKEMGGQLKVSARLGGQLSRRRIIDCFIFIMVFGFFYLTCAHIVLKRLFFYRLFGK